MNDFHAHMTAIQKKLESSVDSYPEWSPSDFEILPFIRSQALHSGEFNPPVIEKVYNNDSERGVKTFSKHHEIEEIAHTRKSTYMGTTITQEPHNIVGVSVTVTHKYKFRKLIKES